MCKGLALVVAGIFLAGLPSVVLGQAGLSWEECLALTSVHNPSLVSAREAVAYQRAVHGVSQSAALPQISGSVDLSETKAAAATERARSYSYGVTAEQLLFDGFSTVNDIRAAAERLKGAEEGYRFTSAQVRFELRNAFVSLLSAQELVRVSDEVVRIRQENLDLISLRYQSGLEHKGALLTAEANMAEASLERSRTRRERLLSQRELAAAMGMDSETELVVQGDLGTYEYPEGVPDLEALVFGTPRLMQSVAAKRAASYTLKGAYGDFAPRVTLSGNAGRKNAYWPPEDDQWGVGIGLSVPIFEGGLQAAKLAQTKASYRQAQADEQAVRSAVLVELEQAWKAYADAVENVDVQHKQLIALEERSQIAQSQYSTGFITFDNWIIIENDLVKAKRGYVQAQADALIAEARWVQAKGETIEYAR